MPLFGSSKPDVKRMEANHDVKGLVKALSYKNDSLVRKAAAEALVKIGDAQAVDGLTTALKHKDTDVRSRALEALVKIGHVHGIDGLVDALKDKDSDVRARIAAVLGNIGDKRAVDKLVDVLKDSNGNARAAATVALGKIGDARAVPALANALKDSETGVRDSAAEAIKELEEKIRSGSQQPTPMVAGVPVTDLSSDGEIAAALCPKSALEMEDEELAKKLAQLSRLSDIQFATDKTVYEKTTAEFRRIGEQLCANGGHERMRRVAFRVKAFGGRSQDCEMYWVGICDWVI